MKMLETKPTENNNTHSLSFEVRDYECDMQGIVNHAVYLHYNEHARHVFMATLGISFKELTENKIYVVAKNLEVNYLKPLRSGDKFEVITEFSRISKLKFCFKQFIQMQNIICLESNLIAVILNANFKPFLPDIFAGFPIKEV